jgi:uncharacterized protein (TIGR00296 family)
MTLNEGTFLVKLARETIQAHIDIHEKPQLDDIPEIFHEKCGVFVTLIKIEENTNRLRGCIGLPYPTKPLIDAIQEAAYSAAFNDPRFPPVQSSEMYQILVEVSVLTPPELINVNNPLEYPRKVVVGKDGLIIGRGYRRGLLLPQVPVEWNWDSEEFLTQCCFKAGLPPDSWLLEGIEISTFQALVYTETEPDGPVKFVDLGIHGDK